MEKFPAWELLELEGVSRKNKMIIWNIHFHAEELEFEVNYRVIETMILQKNPEQNYKAIDPNHLTNEQVCNALK